MSKWLLRWIIFIALLCGTLGHINYSLSESTWQLFRNRNRQATITSSRSDALLLERSPPVPSNAFLSPRNMLLLLGPRFFNPALLSISEPQASILHPSGQLIFPKANKETPDETKRRVGLLKMYTRGMSLRQVERLTGIFNACPIMYKWHDYGEHYWPRWVREGHCVNLGGTSCSLPPGMFCTGHEETTVVLLR